VVSILGANSEIVDKHYTHIGEEAQEKAIHSLFGTANTVSDREKIEKVLALIDSWSNKSEQAVEIESILRNG
jgi:diphthamide biosynthesis methyltransferase